MKEEDALKFLAGGTHLRGTDLDFQMEQCICKRKSDGIYIAHPKSTWEGLLLAAGATVAMENPVGVSVTFPEILASGASPIAGHFISGSFANQIHDF